MCLFNIRVVILGEIQGSDQKFPPVAADRTEPSEKIARTNCATRRPSLKRWPTSVTTSPGWSEDFLQPETTDTCTKAAKLQYVATPFASVTKIRILTCGLTKANSFTVPLTLTSLSWSNITPEWWASATGDKQERSYQTFELSHRDYEVVHWRGQSSRRIEKVTWKNVAVITASLRVTLPYKFSRYKGAPDERKHQKASRSFEGQD